jgi:hypothetical protein
MRGYLAAHRGVRSGRPVGRAAGVHAEGVSDPVSILDDPSGSEQCLPETLNSVGVVTDGDSYQTQ